MFCTSCIVWQHDYKLHLNTLQFVNLDVQNFNPFWFLILIPLFWPFCDWFWPIEMRPHDWWVGLCHCTDHGWLPNKWDFLTLEDEGITFLCNTENCSPNNTASPPIKTSVLGNNAMRTPNFAYSVLVLQTSCYVPYCSIQTWRLRYQRGQISCCEWEWHLPQHFCKLLL